MSSHVYDQLAFAPTDLPPGIRIVPISADQENLLRRVVGLARPDIRVADLDGALDAHDWLVATGPDWHEDLRVARERGHAQRAILFPLVEGSYHEFLAIPPSLFNRDPQGLLTVEATALSDFIAGFGRFFGSPTATGFEHDLGRYSPLYRTTQADAEHKMRWVLDRLGDSASRADYETVLVAKPDAMWRHWLRDLFNGVQYLDYVTVVPGQTVLNCGVHGGNEIALFLACLGDSGHVLNVDPLGHDFLLDYSRRAISAFGGRVSELRVALHDNEGEIDLPVEPGGMAAGGLIGVTVDGAPSRRFRAARLDDLVKEANLSQVDLIKFDIEGAEPRALVGAMDTIRQYRPSLALAIYHTPDQFLDIPIFLMTSLTDYDFFVRTYHWISNETIFYALPRERPRRIRSNSTGALLVTR